MMFLMSFVFSALAFAGLVNNPEYDLQFCFKTKEAVYKKELQWKHFYREMIQLRHGKVLVGMKVVRHAARYEITFGEIHPEMETFSESGRLVLDDKNHAEDAKLGGGSAGRFTLYIVPKTMPKEDLAKLCPGEKSFELKLIE